MTHQNDAIYYAINDIYYDNHHAILLNFIEFFNLAFIITNLAGSIVKLNNTRYTELKNLSVLAV